MKKVLLIAVCLIIGFIAGFAATFSVTARHRPFLLQEKEVLKLGQASLRAYLHEPNDVAFWAMTTYLERLENLANEQSTFGYKYGLLTPTYRQIAHVRLGFLYSKMGESNKAQIQFELALKCNSEMDPNLQKTQSDLFHLVKYLDEQEALDRREADE